MSKILKRILSIMIILSMSIQLGGYVNAFANTDEYKDAYSWLYLSAADGEDKYLPYNFGFRDGLGMDTSTGHFASWKNVMFSESPVSVEVVYATLHAGTTLEFRLDSSTGQVIATLSPEPTGGMYAKKNIEINVDAEVTGAHTLYAVWKTGYLNIECFKFKKYGKDTIGYSMFDGIEEDSAFEDLSGNQLSYEIRFLNQLGMLGFAQDNKFEGKKTVTKAELAQALCGFYTDKVTEEGMYFLDLPSGHSMSKYVNYMYHKGIIEMTADQYFRPDTVVTVEQALKVIKKIFNLPSLDSDFIKQTEKTLEETILSGVSAKLTANLTRQDLARMLSNALEATYITYKTGNDGEIELYFTEGILSETRNLNKSYGLVTAIPSTSLSSIESGIAMNEVMIDDRLYNDNKKLAQKYLGYNCVIFYEEIGGEYEIRAIYPRKNVSETVINTVNDDELESITEQMIEYSDANGKQKRIRLNNIAYFIYNGKAIDDNIDKFVDINTFQGKMRIIDNKDCTVIVIDEYQNAVIKAIDNSKEKYLDRISDTIIDLTEDNATIYKDSRPILSTDMPVESAAYIYRSKNTIGERITRIVILPDNKISGIINAIKDDKITIDGNEYKIAQENSFVYTIGMFGEFRLNTYNEIIWGETGTDSEMKIGVYLGYYINEEEETILLKLFTDEQKIEKFECSKKLILDGVSRSKVNQAVMGRDTHKGLMDVETRTPVMYLVNEENKITVIDTYFEGRKNRFDMLTKVGTKQQYRCLNGPRILVEQTKGYSGVPFESESTLISYWKDADDTYNQIEKFVNQIHSVQFPIGQAYSSKGSDRVADIFVWMDREYYGGSEYMVVEEVTEELDEDDCVRQVIKGYVGAKEITKVISEQISSEERQTIDNILENLQRGDFIKMNIDSVSNVKKIEVQYFNDGASSRSGISSVLYKENGGNFRIGQDYVLGGVRVLGKITDIEDKFIFIKSGEGSNTVEEAFALNAPGIVRVNKKYIEKGLSTREVFNSETNGHTALMLVESGYVQQIVIYE